MQRLLTVAGSLMRATPTYINNKLSILNHIATNTIPTVNNVANFSIFQKIYNEPTVKTILSTATPLLNFACGMKVRGRLRRRCKDCYFVVRSERLYVMCPTHGRHKTMSMVKRLKNTWILTHASQSKVRPW